MGPLNLIHEWGGGGERSDGTRKRMLLLLREESDAASGKARSILPWSQGTSKKKITLTLGEKGIAEERRSPLCWRTLRKWKRIPNLKKKKVRKTAAGAKNTERLFSHKERVDENPQKNGREK